jgi:hypothetical protein
LIYVPDPDHANWLIGYDWSGRPRATVKLSEPPGTVQMAPDGQSFLGKGGSGDYLDRFGQGIPTQGAVPGYVGGIWGDDNKHRCSLSLDRATYELTLYTELPAEAPKRVAIVARDSSLGQTGIGLAACSVRNDQAILVQTKVSWPTQIWVITLSGGTVLSHYTYPDGLLADIVASPDATYIAENTFDTIRLGVPQSPGVTRIRRVSDWVQVATVGSSAVRGFSGDDSLALVTHSLLPELTTVITAVNWRTGKVIWHVDNVPYGLQSFLVQPGGSGFALALNTGEPMPACPVMTPPVCMPRADIVIVHRDGTTVPIPGRYPVLW